MDAEQRFKVVLTGDAGVGKTTWIKRFLNGDFEKRYIATLGVDVHPLTFSTNHGLYTLDIWDTAGQEKFGGLMGGYALDANAVIGMFDVTSRLTVKNMPYWHNEMEAGKVHTVACGNKCDLPQKVSTEDKLKVKDQWDQYYDISAKSNYNYEKPFLYLLQKLTGHKDLEFVAEPPE